MPISQIPPIRPYAPTPTRTYDGGTTNESYTARGGPTAPPPRIVQPPTRPAPTAAPPVAPPPPTTTAQPPVPPVAPPQGPAPAGTGNQTYDDSTYRQAREQELTAALQQLESQHNLSREQMLADQTEAGEQYRFIMSALQRSKEEAIAQTQSGHLQRGTLRSGIYQGDEARAVQGIASQEAAATADKTQKLNAIQMSIAELESQFAQGSASGSSAIVMQQLAAMKEMANSLAADDALGQRAASQGYIPGLPGGPGSPGQGGLAGDLQYGPAPGQPGFAPPLPGRAAQGTPTNLSAGRGLASPFGGSGAMFGQMQGPGSGETQYGRGHFVDDRPTTQVIGGDGQGNQVYGGGGQIIANTIGNQQGQAMFGSGVSGADFLAMLNPQVTKGFTPEELQYLAKQTNIPSDAAYGIASRAALISSQRQ